MNAYTENQDDIYEALRKRQRLEESLRVTYKEYQVAVSMLLELAFKDCGGARYAAQALLSLYDGDCWQADLAGVCCGLDGSYFRHVLIAMRGRAMLMQEPHSVIPNGEKLFRELAEDWAYLAKTTPESAL
ncbi:MAG: hypothetical protein KAH34_13325 [Ketobacter sp.]|nr:hypothetical protein [Ketobacter sp.]